MPTTLEPTISKDSLTTIGKFVYRAVKGDCSPEFIGDYAKKLVNLSEQLDKLEFREAD